MLINTKYFGEMNVAEEEKIFFPEPLLGFEDSSHYILIRFYDEPDSMFCLQSTSIPDAAFVLADPVYIVENYTVSLSPDDFKTLQADKDTLLAFYVIAVVRDDWKDSTVNLRCPIAVNPEKKLGKQLIMEDTSYSMRHPIDAGAKEDV